MEPATSVPTVRYGSRIILGAAPPVLAAELVAPAAAAVDDAAVDEALDELDMVILADAADAED